MALPAGMAGDGGDREVGDVCAGKVQIRQYLPAWPGTVDTGKLGLST
jgi:hypothetical protein